MNVGSTSFGGIVAGRSPGGQLTVIFVTRLTFGGEMKVESSYCGISRREFNPLLRIWGR